MKIKSCEIKNFGKLRDKKVDPSAGITVIKGRNESGKSTFSYFVKYALYGFAGKGRDEKNNEKTRYTPWSGEKCSGALVLEDDNGEIYRIERTTDSKGTKSRILNSMGDACFEGEEAGEVFFGIDSAAFAKSSFVGQNDIEPDMKDLGKSLEKLLLNSDNDDVDYDKAVKVLTAERNQLYNKSRSTGKVFELSERISELRRKSDEQAENYSRLNVAESAAAETEKRLGENSAHLEGLYAEEENLEAYRAAEMLEKLDSAERAYTESANMYFELSKKYSVNGFLPDRKYADDLARAYSEYISALPELVKVQNELEKAELGYASVKEKLHRGNAFDDSIESDKAKVTSVLESARTLAASAKKLRVFAVVFLLLIITIPVSVVMFMLSAKKKKQLSEMLGRYGFSDLDSLEKFCAAYDELFGSLCLLKNEISEKKELFDKKKLVCASLEEMLYAKLMRIGFCDNHGEMLERLSEINDVLIPELREHADETGAAYSEYIGSKNAYNALASVSDIDELRVLAAKKRETPPDKSKEELERAIKYDEGARSLLTGKLSDLKAEVARYGALSDDPADTENEIHELEKELRDAVIRSEALDMAITYIGKARDEIREDVFPQISGRAGELFSKFTDGKYRSLFFDKKYTVKVLEENDTETRKAISLSSGAADAAYIALRVALAEHLCTGKPMLIFDDSFATIDDNRLANILNVLKALSAEYQIMILTCHDREERMLGSDCRVLNFDEV